MGLRTDEVKQIKTIDATMQFKTKAQLDADCIAKSSKILPCKGAAATTIKAFQKLKCTDSCKGSNSTVCQASDDRLTTAFEGAIKAYTEKIESKAKQT